MERVQKEEIQSGRKEGKRFEGESGVGALHLQRGGTWVKLNSGGIQAGEVISRRSRDAAGSIAPGVRAV